MSAALLEPGFLAQLEQLELVTRRIFLGRMKGERRSKRKGQSVEFADYRNYVVGDDLRHLDWNLFARLDKLFLRLFQEEEDLHFHLLIDNSLSMDFGHPSKSRYARQVAAALGFVGLANLDRVRVQAFNDGATLSSPALRGRRSLWRLLAFLDQLQPAGPSRLAQALRAFALRTTGKGIVVVLSDFMDKAGYEDALRCLVARQMDVFAIQILSQEEIDPEIDGDVRLVDAEDDDAAEVTAGPLLLRRYRENLAAFQAGLQEFCTKRGVSFLAASTATPFDKLVLTSLRQRGLVRG